MADKTPETIAAIREALDLQAAGNAGEAVRHLKALHEKNPQDADILSFLGTAEFHAGDRAGGEANARRALEIEPGNVNCRYNLAFLLSESGRLQDAIGELKTAIKLKPGDKAILMALGQSYFRAGRFTKSAECWERLAKKEDKNPQVLFQWTRALLKRRDYDRAHEIFQRFLALTDETVETLYIAGHIALMRRDLKESVEYLDRALALKRNYSPALVDKARALVFQGDLKAAKPLFEQGLKSDPGNVEAYLHYTEAFPGAADDEIFAALKALTAKQPAGSSQLADAHFALGGMLRARKDADAAFAAYRTANETMKALLAHQRQGYDPAAEEQKFAALKARFAKAVKPAKRSSGPIPLFIVGLPRSGTSLMETMLASHPKVRAGGERYEMRTQFAALEERALKNPKKAFDAVLTGFATDAAKAYLKSLPKLKRPEEFVTDKLPDNFLFSGLIAAALPRARIVHMKRDIRDTALSLYFHNFGSGYPYSVDLGSIAHYAKLYEDLMAHWRALYPGKILDVVYEELVDEPEREIRAILDFCRIKWDPACLEFYKNPGTMVTMSAAQVRKPLTRRSIGRWKKYRKHLTSFTDGDKTPQ